MRAVEADRGAVVEEKVEKGATGLGKGGIEGSTVGLGVEVLGRRRQMGGWWGWLLVLLAFLTVCGAEPAGGGRQVGAACALTITPCAARWGTTRQRAGLSAVCELAERRSQASELAEWCAEVVSEGAESATAAAGCRKLESGCRTGPAQAGQPLLAMGASIRAWGESAECVGLTGCPECLRLPVGLGLAPIVMIIEPKVRGKSTLVGARVSESSTWGDGQRCTATVHRRWGQCETGRCGGHCWVCPSGVPGAAYCSGTGGTL